MQDIKVPRLYNDWWWFFTLLAGIIRRVTSKQSDFDSSKILYRVMSRFADRLKTPAMFFVFVKYDSSIFYVTNYTVTLQASQMEESSVTSIQMVHQEKKAYRYSAGSSSGTVSSWSVSSLYSTCKCLNFFNPVPAGTRLPTITFSFKP